MSVKKPQELREAEFTLKLLNICGVFPKKRHERYLGKWFYLKYSGFFLISSIYLIGCILHFIVSVLDHQYGDIYIDLLTTICLFGCYWITFAFIANIRSFLKLLTSISNFHECEKSPARATFTEKMNFYSKTHCVYLISSIVLLISAPLFTRTSCEKQRTEMRSNVTCGLLPNAWMPFDVNRFPTRDVFYVIQSVDAFYLYLVAGEISWIILEIIEHVIFCMKLTARKFVDAVNAKCIRNRKALFAQAVFYHNLVYETGEFANASLKNVAVLHVILTSAILGISAFGFMQTHSTLLLATFYGWFVGLVLICYAGHRLMEKSVALGDEIYLKSTWDDLDKGAQIDFAFVLLRSQKPLVLRGGPLAIMSLNVIIQVLKAAMSYITLLRETQEV